MTIVVSMTSLSTCSAPALLEHEHPTCHSEHCLVPLLTDVVLLRGVRGREMALYPFAVIVFIEGGRHELAAMIRMQHAQLVAVLYFRCSLVLGDGLLRLVLGGEQHHPNEPVIVVDEQHDVATPSWRCLGVWTPEIPVNQL